MISSQISRQASILQSVSMRSNFRGLKDTADEYEDAFRKIRLATNLSEDDKIIERQETCHTPQNPVSYRVFADCHSVLLVNPQIS